jgi:phosphoserine/homoserine phosphotransferase
MAQRPVVIAMDLEGVLVPEVWIAVAEATRIPELRLTTRDIPDYDVLMRGRLTILREHGLKLTDIQAVIRTMCPLPGALDYVRAIKARHPLIILSDTYYEFAAPLMAQLEWPTLFCNTLETDAQGFLVGYRLRQRDGKRHAVLALRQMCFSVIAVGDSFNDLTMLEEGDLGILFRPSDKVRQQAPHFPVVTDYDDLIARIAAFVP